MDASENERSRGNSYVQAHGISQLVTNIDEIVETKKKKQNT